MAERLSAPLGWYTRVNRRSLRLASGTLLFTFVATHLSNHAAGLASLEAAEAGRLLFIALWRNPVMTTLFYSALVTHILLAFIALYDRRTLHMPRLEITRIVLGFSVPFLLADHFIGTRIAYELYEQADRYTRVVWVISSGGHGLKQITLLCAAWIHGCFGIHFVLRHREAYKRNFHFIFAGAVLLPVLAVLGYLSMADELALRARDPVWFEAQITSRNVLDAAERAALGEMGDVLMISFACLLGGVLIARALRTWRERRGGLSIALTYPSGVVHVPRGWSVLEASRAHGIAHLSLCGGRARCSTCRVRIDGDMKYCPPPSPIEQRTLERIGASPQVRLACQLRPTGDIGVTPLLPAASVSDGATAAQFGREREVVVLFIDLRRWTTLSEQHLPHDLAYVLEQYFVAVGDAVRAAGGIPNQFIGDSVMAIFGIDTDRWYACRQAISAARGIESRMAVANERVRQEFGHSLEFGVGIHSGTAAVGEVGYKDTRTFTAVGDAVNTASRLQELCKDYHVRLVISERVARAAGVDTSGLDAHMIDIRGRSSQLRIYAIPSASMLAEPELAPVP